MHSILDDVDDFDDVSFKPKAFGSISEWRSHVLPSITAAISLLYEVFKRLFYKIRSTVLFIPAYVWKFILVVLYFGIGTFFYNKLEKWDIVDCLFFQVYSVTTVGYGSLSPSTRASRMFTVFFLIFGCAGVLIFCNEFALFALVGSQEYFIEAFHKLFFRNVQISKRKMRNYKIIMSWIVIFIAGIVGSLFYSSNEGWSFDFAVYYTVVTMTGVGYGEVVEKHKSTRLFGIVFMLTCCCLYCAAATNIFGTPLKDRCPCCLSQRQCPCIEDKNKVNKLLAINTECIGNIFEQETQSKNDMNDDMGMKDKIMNKEKLILEILLKQNVINMYDDVLPILKVINSIEKTQNRTINKDDSNDFVKLYRQSYCEDELKDIYNPLIIVK